MSRRRNCVMTCASLVRLIGYGVLLAATVSLLVGCAGTPKVITAQELCTDWRRQTISKHDKLTQGTAEQIEANNKTRQVWGCHKTENRAAS